MSITELLQSFENDGRLARLFDELEAALKFLGEDEKNKSLREKVVFRQLAGLLMTDSERAAWHGLPKGCRMRENAKIISPEKLDCAEHVYIGEGAIIDASGGLAIGPHTTVAAGVFVWTHTSHKANLAMANYPGSELIERKPTKIGAGVFIGGPAVVVSGVTIGDRTVILPMSCVTSDIPGNCMAGGSPAKVIKAL
ncbi:MAG: acyltransferase [Oscillospiraceae bacterium]|nr:acyltransferase [Oscillospiraceae bacterium]